MKCRLGFIKLFEVQISFKPQLDFQKTISTRSFATFLKSFIKLYKELYEDNVKFCNLYEEL